MKIQEQYLLYIGGQWLYANRLEDNSVVLMLPTGPEVILEYTLADYKAASKRVYIPLALLK